ncbi:galactose-1-phosphate uridyl transferase [Dimargaris verticillata]|uniref:Galactose-1-phosphate uridylyltransferase n=1 Tax=Dimargaris verticillata TaxID=2761393 RepID=A0A9W8EC83_9FUNG|nr:galactose-1-phosphate uridyl transferase [Dimargaris verticillata]
MNQHVHERFNPLTRTWVLCSPHRANRPWQGQCEVVDTQPKPRHDPHCYLCPGNARASQLNRSPVKNPPYTSTLVFDNDFPALLPLKEVGPSSSDSDKAVANPLTPDGLLRARPVNGKCLVICFSPRHDQTLAEMSIDEVEQVVTVWRDLYGTLRKDPTLRYAQFFENKGPAMGCSNPHPHGQVWALDSVPHEVAVELDSLHKYRVERAMQPGESTVQCLLCDYVRAEIADPVRVVCQNEHFLCVVPYWAVWPFETLVLSKSHLASLTNLALNSQQRALADILRRITCRYDNLFTTSFPYSMGIHQAPFHQPDQEAEAHLHIHFYPPLLRSATVRKFLVGFELLGQPQRDITAEAAAELLRRCSEVHFKQAERC